MLKIMYEQKKDDDYKFKFEVQKKIDSLEFKVYLDIIEKLEKGLSHLKKSGELNSLNMLHIELELYILDNLKMYLK